MFRAVNLILAVIVCLAAAENDEEQAAGSNVTYPELTMEQIASILQNPLFRNNLPTAQQQFVPNYLRIPENERGSIQLVMHSSDTPNTELQVPDENAEDVYERAAGQQFIPSNAREPQWEPQPGRSFIPSNGQYIQEIPQRPRQPQQIPIHIYAVPSKHLEVPEEHVENNENFYAPATELQLPVEELQERFRPSKHHDEEETYRIPSQELEPPKIDMPKRLRNPTNVYPKKYKKTGNFKPKPIPLEEFAEDPKISVEVVKSKPFGPVKLIEEEQRYSEEVDPHILEKKRLKFEEAQAKKQAQEELEAKKQQEFVDATVAEAFGHESPTLEQDTPTLEQDIPTLEQETPILEQDTASANGFNAYKDPRNTYAAPVVGESSPGVSDLIGPAGDRTEFRMHGMNGPNSYKFGYDTGKGSNRQFRFEERDNDGHVRGHYGYYDRQGKLQVVNYDAHPELGFHAEGPFGKA